MNEPTTASQPVLGVVWHDEDGASLVKRGSEDAWCANHRGYSRLYAAPQPAPSAVAGEDALAKARALLRTMGRNMLNWTAEDVHLAAALRQFIEAAVSPSAPTQGQDHYDARFGVHDEASLRAAGRLWEALEYHANSREDGEPGEYERHSREQIAVERAIASHDHTIDENDNYVRVTPPAPDGGEAVAIWRLLEVGELIERGDEWWDNFTNGWRATNDQGLRVLSTKPYRRRALAVIHNPSAPKAGDAEKAK